jgi:hypothetical protein
MNNEKRIMKNDQLLLDNDEKHKLKCRVKLLIYALLLY